MIRTILWLWEVLLAWLGYVQPQRELNLSSTRLEGEIDLSDVEQPAASLRALAMRRGVTQFAHIRLLDLSNNRLVSLKGLTALPQLSSIIATNNCLTELPDDIGVQCPRLRSVDLEKNALSALPVSLLQCTELENLFLAHNQLMVLPEGLFTLPNLQLVDLSSNQLAELPRRFSCPNLLRLHLSGNQLASLPSELGTCIALQELHVASNQLISLPTNLGLLVNLALADFRKNNLTALPASLQRCQNLRTFYAEENPWASLADLRCREVPSLVRVAAQLLVSTRQAQKTLAPDEVLTKSAEEIPEDIQTFLDCDTDHCEQCHCQLYAPVHLWVDPRRLADTLHLHRMNPAPQGYHAFCSRKCCQAFNATMLGS